jgi:SagB-type dehydrogenase family enzyme
MEWRYDVAAHKVIALDAGHVCQNLYLACEAVDAGTCAIGAYDQEELDDLLGVDGIEEFAIYLAPVGKVPRSDPPRP